jgi:hypothetical protein
MMWRRTVPVYVQAEKTLCVYREREYGMIRVRKREEIMDIDQ